MYIIDAIVNNWRDILSYILYAYIVVAVLYFIFVRSD
jgi:hypothetical protein